MPETRKVLQAHIDGVESQLSIPWCTTHGSIKDDTFTEFDVCQAHRIQRRFAPKDLCKFSTGGIGHRWWVDV